MSDEDAVDLTLLLLRSWAGAVMLAHGINHVFGGGRIAGTTRWFASLGLRPGRLHAWLASITEIGAGILLVLGLLTPFGAAGLVGVMVVALMINHRPNGFFIFRPGEGWEYVATLTVVGITIGGLGPGTWSLDEALDVRDELVGAPGLLVAALIGGGGALVLLAACWRPQSARLGNATSPAEASTLTPTGASDQASTAGPKL